VKGISMTTFTVFKKRDGPGEYIFANGSVGVFEPDVTGIVGILETNDSIQIAEMNAQIAANHPTIYQDGQTTANSTVNGIPDPVIAEEVRQDISADNIDPLFTTHS